MSSQIIAIMQYLLMTAIPIIYAITIHEAAHGYAAKHFGDMTAHQLGRISLNPIRHIDLFGTIILPAMTMILGGVFFGWAKPVPVNYLNFKRPKQDMLWVAAAGPLSNLAQAIIWGMVYGYATYAENYFSIYLFEMSKIGISINVVLMVLNLFPIPPLDGGRIAVSLLPTSLAMKFAQIEKYGFFILIILLFSGVLSGVLTPIVNFVKLTIKSVFV